MTGLQGRGHEVSRKVIGKPPISTHKNILTSLVTCSYSRLVFLADFGRIAELKVLSGMCTENQWHFMIQGKQLRDENIFKNVSDTGTTDHMWYIKCLLLLKSFQSRNQFIFPPLQNTYLLNLANMHVCQLPCSNKSFFNFQIIFIKCEGNYRPISL